MAVRESSAHEQLIKQLLTSLAEVQILVAPRRAIVTTALLDAPGAENIETALIRLRALLLTGGGVEFQEQAKRLSGRDDLSLWQRVMLSHWTAAMLHVKGDKPAAVKQAESALTLARENGDPMLLQLCLLQLGNVLFDVLEFQRGEECLRESGLGADDQDERSMAHMASALSRMHYCQRNYGEASDLALRAAAHFREMGNAMGALVNTGNAAEFLRKARRFEEALECAREGIRQGEKLRSPLETGRNMYRLMLTHVDMVRASIASLESFTLTGQARETLLLARQIGTGSVQHFNAIGILEHDFGMDAYFALNEFLLGNREQAKAAAIAALARCTDKEFDAIALDPDDKRLLADVRTIAAQAP